MAVPTGLPPESARRTSPGHAPSLFQVNSHPSGSLTTSPVVRVTIDSEVALTIALAPSPLARLMSPSISVPKDADIHGPGRHAEPPPWLAVSELGAGSRAERLETAFEVGLHLDELEPGSRVASVAAMVSDSAVHTDERPGVAVVVEGHPEQPEHVGNPLLRTANRIAERVAVRASRSDNKFPDPRARCSATTRRQERESLVVVFVPVEDDINPLSVEDPPQIGHLHVGSVVGSGGPARMVPVGELALRVAPAKITLDSVELRVGNAPRAGIHGNEMPSAEVEAVVPAVAAVARRPK